MSELPRPAIHTFLIADVRGYTRYTLQHGDEAGARLAARFAALAEEVTAAHDGAVLELRGDEALCVFLSTREALRAAVQLHERMGGEDEPIPIGVGIDVGEAIPVGEGFRGAALNLAARLCGVAGTGEVLISDTVAGIARQIEGLTYVERGFIELKGFAAPVHVLEVRPVGAEGEPVDDVPRPIDSVVLPLGPPATQHFPIGGYLGSLPAGPLVAREEELERITTALEAATRGEGQFVLLAGEAGVGKTRLAQEMTLVLRGHGFLIGAGRCYEPQAGMAYHPFLEALATLHAAAPPAIRREVLRRWAYLAHLLPDLGNEAPVSASGEDQQRLFHAVTGFLVALSRVAPVALLLDDLHWADGATLSLLQHLARHTRTDRVLLLGTYRDVEVGRQHPLSRALRDLAREHLTTEIPVHRLSADGTAQLIAATIESGIDPRVAAAVHDHTEGNPFFVREVLQAMVERGDIYRAGEGWQAREIEDLEIPRGIRDAIGDRLSRLSASTQDLLQVAAVLGQTFAFDDLETVSGEKEEAVEEALEDAIGTGLIRPLERDRYAFAHALTQQVLLAELSPHRRRRLHQAVGEALSKLPERSRAARAAELAWHFLHADDAEQALPYALLAGDAAEKVFAHGEAEGQFRTAAELAEEIGDEPARARALESLGRALIPQARHDEALAALEDAAERRHRRNEHDAERRIVALIGLTAGIWDVPAAGIERVERALAAAEPEASPDSLAELWSALATLYQQGGRYAEIETAAGHAAVYARQAGDDRLVARSEVRRAAVIGAGGDHEASIRILNETLPLVERIEDLDTWETIENNLAWEYTLLGDNTRKLRHAERALQVAERHADATAVGYAQTVLAHALFCLGRWDEALAMVRAAYDGLRALNAPGNLAMTQVQLADLLVRRGEDDEGMRHLQAAMEAADPTGDALVLSWAAQVLGERAVRRGEDLEEARDLLERRLDVNRRGGWYVASVTGVLAAVYEALGEQDRAAAMAEEGVRQAERENNRLHAVPNLLALGTVRTRQDRWAEAGELFERALQYGRSAPHPYDEARTLAAWGQMGLPREDEAARERLQQAAALFGRLGAVPEQRAIEGMLAAGVQKPA